MAVKVRPTWVWLTALVAIAFGILTIKSGGSVLFLNGEAKLAAGHYVDFVLWFNFVAGFFYIITSIAIWLEKSWSLAVAMSIAALTLLAFGGFGLHILYDGEYEQRTVVAMSLRTFVWIAIAATIRRYTKR